MNFMVPRLARKYAAASRPTIIQHFKSIYDPIVPIHLGDFQPELIEKPTAYFTVRKDDEFRYLLYCFFHRKDWSTWIPPFKALDEHEYDFEGVVFEQSKKTGAVSGIAVNHMNFEYWVFPQFRSTKTGKPSKQSNWITIEAGGHGITFLTPLSLVLNNSTYIKYVDYDLVNMANPSILKWLKKVAQPAFNSTGAKMPWQWNDENLVTHFGRERTEGLMWRNPRLLFKLAKEAKLL